jgi:hypothetical protein
MLSVLLSGGIDPQGTGLAIDALPLRPLATALETDRLRLFAAECMCLWAVVSRLSARWSGCACGLERA